MSQMDYDLDIPKFLRRKPSTRKTRRAAHKKTIWGAGTPLKRPTKAQTKILVKLEWTVQQVMRLSRPEAAIIIRLGVGPDARFAKDKKLQFPDKKEDDGK